MDPQLQHRLKNHGLIFFDGDCGFCRFWVRFILERDPRAYFLFAPLRSQLFADVLPDLALGDKGQTVVLFENGHVYKKSDAALRISSRLTFPVSLIKVFVFIPKLIRDGVYDFVAAHRKRLMKVGFCSPLSGAEQIRFLE